MTWEMTELSPENEHEQQGKPQYCQTHQRLWTSQHVLLHGSAKATVEKDGQVDTARVSSPHRALR